MGETNIEWCDFSFNPWIGCTRVSPACDNCYAEARDKRFNPRSGHWGAHAPRKRTKTWGNPVKWNRKSQAEGRRAKVFCASLADVFDNHRSIEQQWRRDLWHLIEETPHLDWLLLTKRPQNFAKFAPARWIHDGCPPNVWIGTTVENQEEADRRIPHLLSIPAAVRFLSCEPLLGPVDIEPWLDWPVGGCELPNGHYFGCADCEHETGPHCRCPKDRSHYLVEEGPRDSTGCPEYVHAERLTIDWVIAGGESGAGARPSNPQWFRDLRDQCAAADVPFHFKQHGEWVSVSEVEGPGDHHTFPDGRTVRRIGKKRAGRTLDGVTHDGMPG